MGNAISTLRQNLQGLHGTFIQLAKAGCEALVCPDDFSGGLAMIEERWGAAFVGRLDRLPFGHNLRRALGDEGFQALGGQCVVLGSGLAVDEPLPGIEIKYTPKSAPWSQAAATTPRPYYATAEVVSLTKFWRESQLARNRNEQRAAEEARRQKEDLAQSNRSDSARIRELEAQVAALTGSKK
jgi:hypothetical protein